MKYQSQKNKLFETSTSTNQNVYDSEHLQKVDLNDNSEQIIKKVKIIQLVHNYDIANDIIHTPFHSKVQIISKIKYHNFIFSVDFPKFPDWVIAFTKMIPKFRVDDAYDPLEINIYTGLSYYWKFIENNHWQIIVKVYGSSSKPLYLDLDLVINNELIWEIINPRKD